jgi:glycerol-3-phosphate cytidylyltransferase
MDRSSDRPLRRVVTFGTFDVLHVGHVSLLERARALGDRLIVGVSSDALNFSKKGRNPVYPEADRLRLIAALRCVDEVFVEESLALKGEYLRQHRADVLVMGDDWAGRFDEFRALCEVVYLPRTPSISTTEIIEVIKRVP